MKLPGIRSYLMTNIWPFNYLKKIKITSMGNKYAGFRGAYK